MTKYFQNYFYKNTLLFTFLSKKTHFIYINNILFLSTNFYDILII